MTDHEAKTMWLRQRSALTSKVFAHFVSVYVSAICADHGLVMMEESGMHTHFMDLQKGLLHCWTTFMEFKDNYCGADVGLVAFRDWQEFAGQP